MCMGPGTGVSCVRSISLFPQCLIPEPAKTKGKVLLVFIFSALILLVLPLSFVRQCFIAGRSANADLNSVRAMQTDSNEATSKSSLQPALWDVSQNLLPEHGHEPTYSKPEEHPEDGTPLLQTIPEKCLVPSNFSYSISLYIELGLLVLLAQHPKPGFDCSITPMKPFWQLHCQC